MTSRFQPQRGGPLWQKRGTAYRRTRPPRRATPDIFSKPLGIRSAFYLLHFPLPLLSSGVHQLLLFLVHPQDIILMLLLGIHKKKTTRVRLLGRVVQRTDNKQVVVALRDTHTANSVRAANLCNFAYGDTLDIDS